MHDLVPIKGITGFRNPWNCCSWNPESRNILHEESGGAIHLNQNCRKFRSKTQWIGSIQPEKSRKTGPFPVGILVEWIAPLNTAQGIRNPTKDWNPESKFHWQKLESSTWNPESTAWKSRIQDCLRSQCWAPVANSCHCCFLSTLLHIVFITWTLSSTLEWTRFNVRHFIKAALVRYLT